jgi:type II secretion system protein H
MTRDGQRIRVHPRSSGVPSGIPRPRGFTLIEMILVVAIALLLAGATAPILVRSWRGQRLRDGARAVVSMSRYCRAMAVLRGRPVVLRLDFERGTLEARALPPKTEARDAEPGAVRDARPPVQTNGAAAAEDDADAWAGEDLLRRLADGVRFESFECPAAPAADGAEPGRGTREVRFHPSGTCDGFRVELRDERGESLAVRVDAVTVCAEVTP